MDDKSITPGDDPTKTDGAADATTGSDSDAGTDNQPADKGDNLDPSKSTDDTTAADGDKKPEAGSDDKGADADDGKKPDDSAKTDDASASPQFDNDIDDWITKRGLPKPENEEQKQEYQALRNSQREYTRAQQAKKDAGELGKAIKDGKQDSTSDDDDLDPLEKEVREIKAEQKAARVSQAQSEFYATANNGNPISTDQHKAIMDILKEKVSRPATDEGKLAALDLWGSPDALPDLLDLANARLKNTDTSVIADEAAQKERERIAKESHANSTNRGAKTATDGTKTPEQERLERFSKW